MGGRGSSSASTSRDDIHKMLEASYERTKGFPYEMNELIDDDGKISLDSNDYKKYSRGQVEHFLANLPYETSVLFGDGDELLVMESDWENNHVGWTPYDAHFAILKNGYDREYTQMHFHPKSDNALYEAMRVFSSADIKGNVYAVDLNESGYRLPTSFAVMAYDGSRFELKYVGGGSRDRKNFASAYARAQSKAIKLSTEADTTKYLDTWLKNKASMYGFSYYSDIK